MPKSLYEQSMFKYIKPNMYILIISVFDVPVQSDNLKNGKRRSATLSFTARGLRRKHIYARINTGAWKCLTFIRDMLLFHTLDSC